MRIKKAIKILKQEWNEYDKKNDEVIKEEAEKKVKDNDKNC